MLPRVLGVLRWLITISLALAATLVVYGIARGHLPHRQAQVLVSLAVVAVGASLLWVDFARRTARTRLVGRLAIAATFVGAGLSLLFIWSRLVLNSGLWRLWWISAAVALPTAHLLLVLGLPPASRAIRILRRVTAGAVIAFAALLIAMAFRSDVFGTPNPVLAVSLAVAGGAQVLGSALLLLFGRATPVRVPWTGLRVALWLALPVVLVGGGFYAGRLSAPAVGALDAAGGFLAGLPEDVVDAQIQADLGRLHTITAVIAHTREQADQLHVTVAARQKADGRSVYTPAEDDAIRSLFFSYLTYRTALLRMVAAYQGFEGLRDPAQKTRAFLVGYAAGSVCYGASLALVAAYRNDVLARAKLNEPEPVWGIPPGMFDRIQDSVARDRHFRLFEEMTAYYQSHGERWNDAGLPPEEVAWLRKVIDQAAAEVTASPLYGKRLPPSFYLDRVRSDAYSPVYAVQSLVSTLLGDTRIVSRPPMISAKQVEEMRARLQPGDIILERRNWFLSNAFLPGFWPHAELYVGTIDDIKRLGIENEPAVRDRLALFTTPAPDGEPRVVMEAISEGVSLSSLSEAARADYIAVLRPRASIEDKKKAIVRAFSHQGKPYDFEFDFFSSDKLVCTELVYRSYDGIVHFDLVKIMGRMTLPAVEIARKFVRERDKPDRQLDLVFFLDTLPAATRAEFREESEFCASADRPREFNE